MRYKLITTDGRAKRAEVETVHGTIQTPVFMNVGTVAAIKGAVSTDDLRQIGAQVGLASEYAPVRRAPLQKALPFWFLCCTRE